MKIIPEIMQECTNIIIKHYAEKAKVQSPQATLEEIEQAVINNWEKVSKEISALYVKTYKELKKIA